MKKPLERPSGIMQFILDMHSGSKTDVSWIRVMGTLVILDVLFVWTLSCFFSGHKMTFSMEDIPWGVVTIVGIMVTGKVGNFVAERLKK
jgi:uncharacterized membrane-anchored protein YitT (DUF2179 family)